MRISFLLPGYSDQPIGGFKAAYEYANGLAAGGHQVSVVHPHSIVPDRGAVRTFKRYSWSVRTRGRRRPLLDWFRLHPSVRLRLVPDLRERHVPDGDFVVATAWQTAAAAAVYGPRKGRRACLVADYENWARADDAVREEMRRAFEGMRLVSYGPAVTEMLGLWGIRPDVEIPVPIDHDTFGLDRPLDARDGVCGFPIRYHAFKGPWDAIGAAILLRARRPSFRFEAFGGTEPDCIPSWIRYLVRPTDADLRRFYNGLGVFVLPSHYESWPLPGLEAMACGAALVAADSVGVRGYARHRDSALIVPRERPDLLAQAVEELLDDADLRIRIASAGRVEARRHLWPVAVSRLAALLENGTA